MNVFKLVLFCATALAINGAEILYHEDLKALQSSQQSSVTPIISLPEGGMAWKIESKRDKAGKIVYYAWSSSGFNALKSEIITVDYRVNFQKGNDFVLCVRNIENQVMIAVTVNHVGELTTLRPIGVDSHAKIEAGKWNKLRYVINIPRQRFDLYLNDMNKPVGTNLIFKTNCFSIPASLWMEGNERAPEPTLLADVKVTENKAIEELPEALSAMPYFILPVRKITHAPTEKDWSEAHSYHLSSSRRENIAEKTKFKIFWDNGHLYVRTEAETKKKANPKNSNFWLNDSIQVFIDPGLTRIGYAHLAANRFGDTADIWCNDVGKNPEWNSGQKVDLNIEKDLEIITFRIPFENLGRTPMPGDLWGFNVGRENHLLRDMCEATSFRPLNAFHSPADFGVMMFFDQKNTPISFQKSSKSLSRALLDLDGKMKTAETHIYTMGKDGSMAKEHESFRKKFDLAKNKIDRNDYFPVLWEQSINLAGMNQQMQKLITGYKKARQLFKEGSIAARQGYVCDVESSTARIFQAYHHGSGRTSAELALAGNEYGGFQVVLTMRPPETLSTIDIEVGELQSLQGNKLPGAKIECFLSDYITTAQKFEAPLTVADALIPGKKFMLRKPETHAGLFFDVYIPSNAPAGVYQANISIAPNQTKTAVTIPIKIEVLPFSLPQQASLRTAMAYHEGWSETYYGKKMTLESRRKYHVFLLAHRIQPLDLWNYIKELPSDAEFDWSVKQGQNVYIITSLASRRIKEVLEKYSGKIKFYYFGHDEILTQSPEKMAPMKEAFRKAKEQYPTLSRLVTAQVDERLYGVADTWCPLFEQYDEVKADRRRRSGEEMWWYNTCYPLAPYPATNLDSPGIDARIIPWMNWKFNLTGYLYWGINHDWVTQVSVITESSEDERTSRNLQWITPEVISKFKTGLRWPEIPWIPFISKLPGGGNFMYPGPDFEPYPSLKLKNFRDGLQDYEYLVLLKNNVSRLKSRPGAAGLVAKAEAALKIPDRVVALPTSYTKDPEELLKFKKQLSNLIIETGKALQ